VADPSNAPPRPLKASEALLLEYLREHADADGCARYGRAALATALGLAPSTAQLAIRGLRELGLLGITKAPDGGANIYCVLTDADRLTVTDADRLNRPMVTDPVPIDAPEGAGAAATRPLVEAPPTPLTASDGNLTDDPSRDAPAPAREADRSPTPIGQLAVAACVDAARAAGRKVEGPILGRLGRAAQAVAAEHDVATILDAARRIGEGAGVDLYTALRAVQRSAPMPAAVRIADADARYADLKARAELSRDGRDPLHLGRLKPGEIVEAEALYVGTYGERRRFDAELWARELATLPIGAILYGIREMAKASPHPPTWGEVAAAAGPTLEHERRKRANARARREDGARV
jgi:hypothetical protein